MQVLHCFADLPEVSFDFVLWQMTVAKFDFVVETAILSEFQNHVGCVFLFFVVVVEELDDVGMIQLMMDVDFFFGVSTMDLWYRSLYHFDGHNFIWVCILGKLDLPIGSETHDAHFIIGSFDELIALILHSLNNA